MTSLTWNDSPNQYVGNFRQYHYGGMPYYKAQAFQGGGGLGMTGGFMWRPFFAKLANLFMNKVVPTASKAFKRL